MPAPRTRACKQVMASISGNWQAVQIIRGDGSRAADIRPLVRLNVSVMVEENGRMETGSHGTGGRFAYELVVDPGPLEGQRRRGAAPGPGQSRLRPRPGRRDAGGAGRRLARHPAARGDRPRPGRRLQPQEDLGLRRPDGQAGGVQGRHRDRRRHHPGPPRLAHHRRRRHAQPAHRADRGRHPDRLYAGPAERAPDGHEADRQRPAPELCPPSDAAHDQHHHAGRQPRAGGDHASR